MSKYNVTHHELLYMPMNAIKYKCKEMWHISINVTYYNYADMIYELAALKDCNNDAVLNKD